VEYEIDLSRPPGERIQNLRWNGKPLSDDEPLRLAVNNYRAGGSGGYSMFRGAKIVWRSQEEIRDMVIRYYIEKKQLPVKAVGNWRIVPEAARNTLVQEALAEAQAATLK
jgi:2',3'-cyclic-nucleotide 2'-phosphodiesterase / 3'-nucleotidase